MCIEFEFMIFINYGYCLLFKLCLEVLVYMHTLLNFSDPLVMDQLCALTLLVTMFSLKNLEL